MCIRDSSSYIYITVNTIHSFFVNITYKLLKMVQNCKSVERYLFCQLKTIKSELNKILITWSPRRLKLFLKFWLPFLAQDAPKNHSKRYLWIWVWHPAGLRKKFQSLWSNFRALVSLNFEFSITEYYIVILVRISFNMIFHMRFFYNLDPSHFAATFGGIDIKSNRMLLSLIHI